VKKKIWFYRKPFEYNKEKWSIKISKNQCKINEVMQQRAIENDCWLVYSCRTKCKGQCYGEKETTIYTIHV